VKTVAEKARQIGGDFEHSEQACRHTGRDSECLASFFADLLSKMSAMEKAAD